MADKEEQPVDRVRVWSRQKALTPHHSLSNLHSRWQGSMANGCHHQDYKTTGATSPAPKVPWKQIKTEES